MLYGNKYVGVGAGIYIVYYKHLAGELRPIAGSVELQRDISTTDFGNAPLPLEMFLCGDLIYLNERDAAGLTQFNQRRRR